MILLFLPHCCSSCELCFSFPSLLHAGHVPHVPGSCTTWHSRQVWSPLCGLSWREEPTFLDAWFNAFGSWFRSYYACRILHQQPQRDMEPSLRTFKSPDQAFPDWVCGDCEAREHVISSFLHVPFTSIQPLFCCHIWIEVYLLLRLSSLRVHLTLFLVQDGLWHSRTRILCKVGR